MPDDASTVHDARPIGPWRPLRRVASTPTSDAYLADRTLDDGVVQAVVHLPRGAPPSEDRLTRFWHASGRVNALNPEGRTRLLGAGVTSGGVPYIAAEIVVGDPLSAWCEQRGATLRERVEQLVAASDVIGAAHASGIAHGTLSPEALCMTPGGTLVVRDLGIEHVAASWLGGELPSAVDDVHALGAVLLGMLTGRAPHATSPEGRTRHAVPDAEMRLGRDGGLGAVVHRALRPSDRAPYPSGSALAEDLRRWLAGLPVLVDFRPGELRRRSALRDSPSRARS